LYSQGFLEDQIVLERNLSVGLLHFTNAAASQFLIGQHIHVRVSSEDVISDVVLHRQFEQQLADAIAQMADLNALLTQGKSSEHRDFSRP